jgi:chromosome partitioning protein
MSKSKPRCHRARWVDAEIAAVVLAAGDEHDGPVFAVASGEQLLALVNENRAAAERIAAGHGQREVVEEACPRFGRECRIENSLALPDSDVRDAIVEVPLGHDNGGIALLPTAYERPRRQTARLLGGDGRQLANVLAPLDEQFDVVLIDTPAGDTVFGRQAMVAADAAIVPMLPGYHELRALTRALDVIEERAHQERTRLELLGVLVLNADRRWRSTKEYGRHLAAMAAGQQIALFDTVIPRHQPVAEHARYGLPTVWLRPKSSVGIAYRALAVEVVERLARRHELRAPAVAAALARAGSPSDPRL